MAFKPRSGSALVGALLLSSLSLSLLLSGGAAVSAADLVAAADNDRVSLAELSLDQLLQVSVFSASRKNQTLSDVSSAVFVINQEDIRHSGATTIPDLLRMVPGVQVAAIDGNSWAISIRGFNGTFANKLLVMIDGRSVYTPLFAGVFWDVQDTLLADVDRIEVIRGPGSTMWGANAVNGVVNIITKKAGDTNGTLLSGLYGSREHGTVSARYGAPVGENANYRLYVKHLDRGDTAAGTPPVHDSEQLTRGGFRFDGARGDYLNLTLQGDIYGGAADKANTIPSFAPPFGQTLPRSADLNGGNFLSRLDWLQSAASKASLQLYYDRTVRNSSLLKEERDTVDLDLQHNLRFAGIHELTRGTGYRFLHDDTAGTADAILLVPQSRSNSLLNLKVYGK